MPSSVFPSSSAPAFGGPQSGAPAPADAPTRQPNSTPTADPQSQEGRQPTSAKKVNGKQTVKKKASNSRRAAADSTPHSAAVAPNHPLPLRPPFPTSKSVHQSREGWQPAKKGQGKQAGSKKGGQSKGRPEGSTLRPDAGASPASAPQGQQGWQPAPGKKASRKQAVSTKATGTKSSGDATLRPSAPATTVLPTQPGFLTLTINRASAATGAAASHQHMPPRSHPAPRPPPPHPVPRAPTAPPGFAASDSPLTKMGEHDFLVGPQLLIQALKDKLAAMPEAACNLVCLETGSAGISACRLVRGELATLLIGLLQTCTNQSNHLIENNIDWPSQ